MTAAALRNGFALAFGLFVWLRPGRDAGLDYLTA